MNINIQANASFKEVNRSQKRYIVMKGSAGSGKSYDTAQNYILRLMQDKGRNLVAMRKSDITNRDSTFAELTGAIYRMFGDKADLYWKINTSPLQLTCKANGNKIIFRCLLCILYYFSLQTLINKVIFTISFISHTLYYRKITPLLIISSS